MGNLPRRRNGWQRINKHGMEREIKRLELRIAELDETVKKNN